MADTVDKIKELNFLLEYVFKYYGVRHQLIKLAEEASELAQAAAVCANDLTKENLLHLREEVADVFNVSSQLRFTKGTGDDGVSIEDLDFDTLEVCLAKMRREKGRIQAGLGAPVRDWTAMEEE